MAGVLGTLRERPVGLQPSKVDRGDSYGDIAFAPDGSFYVLDVGNHRVQQFDSHRNLLGDLGACRWLPRNRSALDVDATGIVYVLDVSRDVVERYATDGTVLGSFQPGTGRLRR